MNNSKYVDLVIASVISLMCGFILGLLTVLPIKNVIRSQAIEAGVGKYVVEEKTGKVTFEFIKVIKGE